MTQRHTGVWIPIGYQFRSFFDRVASDWDTMRIAYYDERVIDRLGDFAALTPDMVVADVGTAPASWPLGSRLAWRR